ncbi:hypothetical protein TSUD_240610 [Trifolium subterraneum]|uniref:Uncharacterized protein n=1 Tax=Trifolium subterraneum TaxID=3900 RepID=A0A2Z6P6Z9_TRISU|nr:hypothetical protein TSUD_240610 [Trifolium subterraneum]
MNNTDPYNWHIIIVILSVMENYRVSINKKQQTDTGKNKSMSGVEAMTYHLPMVKVWKCVQKEQLPISETRGPCSNKGYNGLKVNVGNNTPILLED